jgi:putative addiction module component (TIGR02574 family)
LSNFAEIVVAAVRDRADNRRMSSNLKVPPNFDSVSSDERIEFVLELWDLIAQSPQNVRVPDEHKRILDERLDAYAAEPRPGRPWPEVRDELLSKLRR